MFGSTIFKSVGLATLTPIRTFSQSMNISARNTNDKYYKILKYVKPVKDTSGYKAGDVIHKGLRIPLKSKQFPDYHFETMYFKRQNRGLFGGVQRKRSKTCSESGNKGLRVHLPNIQKSKLWSQTLSKAIQTTVSTKVLKTITKEGGLDSYLTKEKPGRVKTLGLKGWQLRYQVLKQMEHNELPQVPLENGQVQQVYHVHQDGKKITVGKYKLLKELYPLVARDSYTFVSPTQFNRNHRFLTIGEIVDKLQQYDYDFAQVTV